MIFDHGIREHLMDEALSTKVSLTASSLQITERFHSSAFGMGFE